MTTLHITKAVADKYLAAFEAGQPIDGDASFCTFVAGGSKEFLLRDIKVGGFCLRFRHGTNPIYICIYRTPSTPANPKRIQRKLTIGHPTGKFTAETARKIAEGYKSDVNKRIDPAAEKRGLVVVAEKTFASAIPAFLAAREKQHADGRLSLQNLRGEHTFLNTYFAKLHGMPLAMIDTGDVSLMLNEIIAQRGPGAVAKPRRCLSQFFDFCASNSAGLGTGTYMPTDKRNPVTLAKTNPHTARKGAILTSEELGAIWRHAGDNDFGTMLKLLMLTGKRRDEIADLKWSEITIDSDGNSWIVLPAARTKSGKKTGNDDAVPLSPQAVAILRSHEERRGRKREYVFGYYSEGYTNFSAPKTRLDAAVRQELPSLQDWTLHHLRHTMRSTLNMTKLFDPTKLHIDRDKLEVLLGHTLGGLDGIYNGYLYADERRGILNAWADYIDRCIDPSSVVVQLRRA